MTGNGHDVLTPGDVDKLARIINAAVHNREVRRAFEIPGEEHVPDVNGTLSGYRVVHAFARRLTGGINDDVRDRSLEVIVQGGLGHTEEWPIRELMEDMTIGGFDPHYQERG